MAKKAKEKLILANTGEGIAKQEYKDQDGNTWVENDTSGTIDENRCGECGKNVSWTLLLLDGGEAYCWPCLEKKFDVTWAEAGQEPEELKSEVDVLSYELHTEFSVVQTPEVDSRIAEILNEATDALASFGIDKVETHVLTGEYSFKGELPEEERTGFVPAYTDDWERSVLSAAAAEKILKGRNDAYVFEHSERFKEQPLLYHNKGGVVVVADAEVNEGWEGVTVTGEFEAAGKDIQTSLDCSYYLVLPYEDSIKGG